MSSASHQARSRFVAGVILAAVVCVGPVFAETAVWNFDLQSTGPDVHYISPTAACNTAPAYHGYYEISQVQVWVSYSIFQFGPFDVTNQIPPENLSGEGDQAGPPPFDVFNDHVQYPEPPAATTLAADMHMWVDAQGYGRADVTNIYFGTAQYNLGPPFGTVTVQLRQVRVAGRIEVTPLVPADLDGDGDVDITDLATLLANYGLTGGATYAQGDIDGDGDIDLSDLAALLSNYGRWDC
jgi:hypothetical protein